ncbi:MAG: RloB family protein [Candidatus Stygibacter australis]|nr:RloB family protein [Candidatus Stygibacter australis]MDP8320862.1 RloB family protein [Candidatus Stygibacter australis]
MNKLRPLSLSLAIISEGDTEGWYLRQLKSAERINFDIFPKEGRNLVGMKNKLQNLLSQDIYDYIFCLVDMDTKLDGAEKTKYQNFMQFAQKYENVHIIESQPCFEYWFYLHKANFSARYFKTWKNEQPLKPEILKIIPAYEKSKIFYYSKSGQGLYNLLKTHLLSAAKNSFKLKNNDKYHYCQFFTLFGLILCNKVKEINENDFFNCLNENQLCVFISNFLLTYTK